MLFVSDLMSVDLFTLRADDTLREARTMMSLARIRHIPVVDERDRFVGLVTHRDILTASVSRFAGLNKEERDALDAGIPIDEIMRKDVLSVSPETLLRDAARLLLKHKYGCLPVVDAAAGDRLVGIITEADFLRLTISLMDVVDQME